MTARRALALFSGGLDSILACRVIMAQNIEVRALKFVTPFFDHGLLARHGDYQREVQEKYHIDVELVDLSDGYIDLLKKPAHGFGKHFNPCIDCKILMLSRARELMARHDASFLITGEVLGQRPMSQRRDTMRVIERDSGCEGILLRPLSAQKMNPTLAEEQGIVDRERLYGFAGRGRKPQLALAREFGIEDFPNPAGGCLLTDPNLAARIERFYNGLFVLDQEQFRADDFRLLLVGRQFRLPGGHWFVLGRNQGENRRLRALASQDDYLFSMPDRPGPTGLLRGDDRIDEHILRQAAGLVVRYGKKTGDRRLPSDVVLSHQGTKQRLRAVEPLTDEVFQQWLV